MSTIEDRLTTQVAAAVRERRQDAGLSLRAVARDLGMVSSAIYRYVPSRDDLLTRLIIDAYTSLGNTSINASQKGEAEMFDNLGSLAGFGGSNSIASKASAAIPFL